jgi:hypothetical protein
MRALADKSDLETIEPLNVKYLAAYLSSLKVQDALWDIAQRSTSATISTISRGTISKLAVQVPSQERQLELAAAWCEYQELLDRTAQFRRNLERWKARMLDPG